MHLSNQNYSTERFLIFDLLFEDMDDFEGRHHADLQTGA